LAFSYYNFNQFDVLFTKLLASLVTAMNKFMGKTCQTKNDSNLTL
jgi:hypothetical protein